MDRPPPARDWTGVIVTMRPHATITNDTGATDRPPPAHDWTGVIVTMRPHATITDDTGATDRPPPARDRADPAESGVVVMSEFKS